MVGRRGRGVILFPRVLLYTIIQEYPDTMYTIIHEHTGAAYTYIRYTDPVCLRAPICGARPATTGKSVRPGAGAKQKSRKMQKKIYMRETYTQKPEIATKQ